MNKLWTTTALLTLTLSAACASAPAQISQTPPPENAPTGATSEATPTPSEATPAPAEAKPETVEEVLDLVPPADAEKTESGLISKVIEPGTGTSHPGPDDTVTVHYSGWTTDGKLFDTSIERGPATFPLNAVIPGWTEGLQLMVDGETRRFWIPAALAYGDNPTGGRPAGMLIFEVKLISHKKAPKVETPPDVAAPPKHAMRTATGLAYVILDGGTDVAQPTATSTVVVHYSGWTTDGKLFDSSVLRGEKARFPLNAVIPGWTEGVQLMNIGSKFRFWIPGYMAYGDEPNGDRPYGTLVFDIELFAIE